MEITKVVRTAFKLLAGLVAVLVVIVLGYVAFAYLSYLDETTTAGTAYGYTIGQTKAETYRVTQSKFKAGDIGRIHTIQSRDEEMRRHPELAGNYGCHSVADVRDWFENWNKWSVGLDSDSSEPLVIVTFRGDRLATVDPLQASASQTWQPPKAPTIAFSIGQTYGDVYRSLEQLVSTPGYDSLQLCTGWMARRQPVNFDDAEFRFIVSEDTWMLLVGDGNSFFNNIELTFENDRLASIRRHRQYFELP